MMEAILFQWDKACDEMPILKPLAKLAGVGFILLLLFVVFPGLFTVDNERRPDPTLSSKFDPVLGRYVPVDVHGNLPAGRHNVEVDRLAEVVTLKSEPLPVSAVGSAPVSEAASFAGSAKKTLESDQWDYKVEVAYIVDSAFGKQRLQDNTGVWIDSRDLHEVSRHVQNLTLEPPRDGHMPLVRQPVEVQTLRSVVTNCRYYALEVFGEKRLILGGVGEAGSGGC